MIRHRSPQGRSPAAPALRVARGRAVPRVAGLLALALVGWAALPPAAASQGAGAAAAGDSAAAAGDSAAAAGAAPASGGAIAFDPDRSLGGFDIRRADLRAAGAYGVPPNPGPHVNTRRRETTPYVAADGRRLFFASRGRPEGLGRNDLYVSEWQGDGWGVARNLGTPVNSATDEIAPCLMPDGVTLWFSRRDIVQQAYDFMLTAWIEGEWLQPIPVGEPFYSPGDERMATITADGRQLFFTASYKRGRGGFDLYVAYRDDAGRWGDTQNLGPRINTKVSDYSPGISPDGRRLYFSSQRDEVGNFDLYVCELVEGGSWGQPVRLPAPINTRMTEYCPFIGPDGSLYFASDRRRGAVETETEIDE